MNGIETVAELRRLRPDVAIVLSSGFSKTEAVIRFGPYDLAGFLQKPYTAAQLAEIVQMAIAKNKHKSVAESSQDHQSA
jgi:DNA-binding NarL/FixJ family response regulator